MFIDAVIGQQIIDRMHGAHRSRHFSGMDIAVQVPSGLVQGLSGLLIGQRYYILVSPFRGHAIGFQFKQFGVFFRKTLKDRFDLFVFEIMIVGIGRFHHECLPYKT